MNTSAWHLSYPDVRRPDGVRNDCHLLPNFGAGKLLILSHLHALHLSYPDFFCASTPSRGRSPPGAHLSYPDRSHDAQPFLFPTLAFLQFSTHLFFLPCLKVGPRSTLLHFLSVGFDSTRLSRVCVFRFSYASFDRSVHPDTFFSTPLLSGSGFLPCFRLICTPRIPNSICQSHGPDYLRSILLAPCLSHVTLFYFGSVHHTLVIGRLLTRCLVLCAGPPCAKNSLFT